MTKTVMTGRRSMPFIKVGYTFHTHTHTHKLNISEDSYGMLWYCILEKKRKKQMSRIPCPETLRSDLKLT